MKIDQKSYGVMTIQSSADQKADPDENVAPASTPDPVDDAPPAPTANDDKAQGEE